MSLDSPNVQAGDILTQKINLSTKLAYGAGDLGTAITANILGFFLLFFFTNVAGLDPGLAGSILLIGKIWDAVNDPIVGILSDRTHSRLGRRLPWMLYGAIPLGITFFLQWFVPTTDKWGLFWYYVVVAILFNTFYTAVNLPYTALTAELTQDYNERTLLNSFRFTFSIGGSILSLILAQVIFELFKGASSQQASSCNVNSLPYLVLGGACAVIAVGSVYWCVWGIRDRVLALEAQRHASDRNNQQSDSLPFFEQLRIVFSNRPFLYVIGIYFCSWLALQITASIIPYFVVNRMQLTEADFIRVTIAVQGTALAMLFVWGAVSRRFGKKAVYFMGMGLWIIAQIGLFRLEPGEVGLMYVLAVMAGFGVSTGYLIPWSMMPDVTELDELQTGQRREGIFYAFMVLLQKVGLAVGLFVLGQALAFAGFRERVPCQPSPVQPESAIMAIRIAIGPIPTAILICGLVLAYFYPITREKHAEILALLAARKQQEADRIAREEDDKG